MSRAGGARVVRGLVDSEFTLSGLRAHLWQIFFPIRSSQGGIVLLFPRRNIRSPTSPEWQFPVFSFPSEGKEIAMAEINICNTLIKIENRADKVLKNRTLSGSLFPTTFFWPSGKKRKSSFLPTYFWSPPSRLYVNTWKRKNDSPLV